MTHSSQVERNKLGEQAQQLLQQKTDNQVRALKASNDDLRKQLNAREDRIAELERTVDLICLVNESQKQPASIVVPKSRASEVVPIFIWSDWHVEEAVDPRKTLGKNEYNLEIAARRARKCIESTVKMIRHARASNRVRSVFLMLVD